MFHESQHRDAGVFQWPGQGAGLTVVQFQQTIPIEQPDFSSFERLRRIHPIDSHNENRNRMASTHGKMKTATFDYT